MGSNFKGEEKIFMNDGNDKKEKNLFKRIIEKTKEYLVEITVLVSAAATLIPFIVDKLKVIIHSLKLLIFWEY